MTLSQLPRSASRPQSIIETGRLVIDLDIHVALVEDRPVALTEKEYGIIELLSLRKGTILTKEMFLDHLYGGMDEPELKIIDVFVCKLPETDTAMCWRIDQDDIRRPSGLASPFRFTGRMRQIASSPSAITGATWSRRPFAWSTPMCRSRRSGPAAEKSSAPNP